MTQQQPPPAQEGGVKGALTRQVGPLKAWQWAAVVVGAYLVWKYVLGGGGGSSSSASTTAFTPASDGGGGGGGGDGGGALPSSSTSPATGLGADPVQPIINIFIPSTTDGNQHTIDGQPVGTAKEPKLPGLTPIPAPTPVSISSVAVHTPKVPLTTASTAKKPAATPITKSITTTKVGTKSVAGKASTSTQRKTATTTTPPKAPTTTTKITSGPYAGKQVPI